MQKASVHILVKGSVGSFDSFFYKFLRGLNVSTPFLIRMGFSLSSALFSSGSSFVTVSTAMVMVMPQKIDWEATRMQIISPVGEIGECKIVCVRKHWDKARARAGPIGTHDRAPNQWFRGGHGQDVPLRAMWRTRAVDRIMLDPMDIIKINHNIPRHGRAMIIGASSRTAILLKNRIRQCFWRIRCTKNAVGTFGRVRRVWNR